MLLIVILCCFWQVKNILCISPLLVAVRARDGGGAAWYSYVIFTKKTKRRKPKRGKCTITHSQLKQTHAHFRAIEHEHGSIITFIFLLGAAYCVLQCTLYNVRTSLSELGTSEKSSDNRLLSDLRFSVGISDPKKYRTFGFRPLYSGLQIIDKLLDPTNYQTTKMLIGLDYWTVKSCYFLIFHF